MTTLVIPDELAQRLQQVAELENRPIEEVLASLLDRYIRQQDAFAAMDGMFDDEVTDMSTTVRETMREFYRRKYGRPD